MPGRPLTFLDPVRIGHYRMERLLGKGGMGSVYLGRGPDGRRVAVKVMRSELLANPTARRLFDREIRLARRVSGAYTAEVLDYGVFNGQPFLVTKFIEGPTLSAVVGRTGPLDPSRLERTALGVAAALTAIHETGAVHCDLKPSNILLSPEGPIVIDFGVARALDATTQLSRALRGTPQYMAPEQARGEEIGPPADIFAWGGVMAFAASGRPPFGTGNLETLLYQVVNGDPDLTGVPEPLRSVVAEAMNRDPALRPTAAQLHARLTGQPLGSPLSWPATEPPTALTTPGPPASPVPTSWPPATPEARPAASGAPAFPGASTSPGAPTSPGTSSPTWTSPPTSVPPTSVPPAPVPPPPPGARPARRRRVLFAVLAVVAVLAVAVPLVVLTRGGGEAEGGSPEEVSALLAAEALRVRDPQPALASGLALAAYHVAPTREARDSVLAALVTADGAATTFTGHTDVIRSVTFSPDGKLLATRGADGAARLWDSTGRGGDIAPLAVLAPGAPGTSGAVFSPDGKLLATTGTNGGVWLWDPTSRGDAVTPLTTFTGHPDPVANVAFSPDGTQVATAGWDGTARLWKAASRGSDIAAAAVLGGHEGRVWGLAFSPDGKLLATTADDGIVRLWDAASQGDAATPLATFSGHTGQVFGVAFSPDGKWLASTGSEDHTVRLWDAATQGDTDDPVATFVGHTSAVYDVVFGSSGALFATRGDDGTVRLWDATAHGENIQPLTTFVGHLGTVYDVAFSPDDTLLATAGGDGVVRLWDAARRGPNVGSLTALTNHDAAVEGVAFSPDGKLLATASNDHTARLWDLDADRIAQRACAEGNYLLTREDWDRHFPDLRYREPCP
ncbi:WD40 repeat domain-containing serine/threonine protein kinase [Frankia nepalensis]|uniref:WD40 repeat domain-containing serine/threonine protein kinase n=1 Tax=Frankia nepalensis TaxID=1836974 RepID=UPI00288B8751|nr:protein kinase [Frankia nepalensis]